MNPESMSAVLSEIWGIFVFPMKFPEYRKITDTVRDKMAVGMSFRPVMLAPIPMPKLLTERASPSHIPSFKVRRVVSLE